MSFQLYHYFKRVKTRFAQFNHSKVAEDSILCLILMEINAILLFMILGMILLAGYLIANISHSPFIGARFVITQINPDAFLIWVACIPLFTLLWFETSLHSFYGLWDEIKKYPLISCQLICIFKGKSSKWIQNIYPFCIWGPIAILFIITSISPILFFFLFFVLIFITLMRCIQFHFDDFEGLRALLKERLREIKPQEPHDAIIICHYEHHLKYPPYGDGIAELMNNFHRKNIPYITYECSEPDDFKPIVYNPKTKNLWIFGHGTRSSLNFGTGYEQLYIELKDAPKKLFIGQFHCNGRENPDEKSLADLISTYGYVTPGLLDTEEIRRAIHAFTNIIINCNNIYVE